MGTTLSYSSLWGLSSGSSASFTPWLALLRVFMSCRSFPLPRARNERPTKNLSLRERPYFRLKRPVLPLGLGLPPCLLSGRLAAGHRASPLAALSTVIRSISVYHVAASLSASSEANSRFGVDQEFEAVRSEERRVGKECR